MTTATTATTTDAAAPPSSTIRVLAWIGELTLLAGRSIRSVFRAPPSLDDVSTQVMVIGYQSIAIVALTAIFSGLVMVVQTGVQLARFGAREYVGTVVALSLVRELGPVLTALMLGGRVGAGITAEIGSMNVTEQLDAMRAMSADPVRKLVLPRVLAGMLCLPLLTVMANALGIGAAMLMGAAETNMTLTFFYHSIVNAVKLSDLLGGLAKTVFFGFSITLIACHIGLRTRGGTEGVGRATTRTVVLTSIVTLISDFVMTKILLGLGM